MSEDIAAAQSRIGQTLGGKWRLERLLGLGGMAAVYEGRHRNGARVAVKILHRELATRPEICARFLREAYVANSVGHRGVVRVIDDELIRSGPDAGLPFLVMDYLEGETPLTRANRVGGRLAEGDALALAEGVLEVLVAAHERGVIHRDLKPDNVFIVNEGAAQGDPLTPSRIRVLDFGIARLVDRSGSTVRTRTGDVVGTPLYMAPEQVAGRSENVDGRADLFALGATIFRLMSGRRLHEASSDDEVLRQMAQRQAPSLRSALPGASVAVTTIVDRALRFHREDRYPSAADMLKDVQAARAGAPLPSTEEPMPPGSITEKQGAPAGMLVVPEPTPPPTPARPLLGTQREVHPIHVVAAKEPSTWLPASRGLESTRPDARGKTVRWQVAALLVAIPASLVVGAVLMLRVLPELAQRNRANPSSGGAQGGPRASVPSSAEPVPGGVNKGRLCKAGDFVDCREQCETHAHAQSCRDLGELYEKGTGVGLDYDKSLAYYQKACAMSYGPACFDVGRTYAEGLGRSQDFAGAYKWYTKGCDLSDGRSCLSAGWALFDGSGVERDAARALEFFHRACELATPEGCGAEGNSYLDGDGVKADRARAIALLRRACKAGHEKSCKGLDDLKVPRAAPSAGN